MSELSQFFTQEFGKPRPVKYFHSSSKDKQRKAKLEAPKLVVANGTLPSINVARIARCSASHHSSGSTKTNTIALHMHLIVDPRSLEPNTSLLLTKHSRHHMPLA
jgi:hypothetical protein